MRITHGLRPAMQLGLVLMSLALPMTSQAGAALCFRGRPLPDCRTFLLFEPGLTFRLGGSGDGGQYVNGDVGWMNNRSERIALGATAFVGSPLGGSTRLRLGVRPRVRYWLSAKTSLDGTIGPFVAPVAVPGPTLDFNESPDEHRLGVAGQVGLNVQDRISFVLQVEQLSTRGVVPDPGSVHAYAGARLGSRPGVLAVVAVGFLYGAVAVAGF